MSTNMTLIETKTVGSGGSASIDFTSIPSTYTDLMIVYSLRVTSGNFPGAYISFNGSTSNFTAINLYGSGSSASSDTTARSIGFSDGSTQTDNTFTNGQVYIPNYLSGNYKSYSADNVTENNATTAYSHLVAGLWSDVSTINRVTITPSGSTFVQYSSASLYGISAVTSTPKATGGIISQDATYWYHTFPFTSTFTPTTNLTCDYLVIAGGGGGGNNHGGAGAGGLRSTVTVTGGGGSLESAVALTSSTAYTITVGAGGAGQTYSNRSSVTSGANSSIAGSGLTTITSTGGGYGANDARAAATGGSGGGGAAGGTTGAAGTTNQGYAGGNAGNSGAILNGGGGGGAGAPGNSGNSGTNVAGNGGAGVAISAIANATFTGVNTYYAGGGGGSSQTGTNGTGGVGGGGNAGPIEAVAQSGVVNTGSGGGASVGGSGTSGNGGSGLVVIRYAK